MGTHAAVLTAVTLFGSIQPTAASQAQTAAAFFAIALSLAGLARLSQR